MTTLDPAPCCSHGRSGDQGPASTRDPVAHKQTTTAAALSDSAVVSAVPPSEAAAKSTLAPVKVARSANRPDGQAQQGDEDVLVLVDSIGNGRPAARIKERMAGGSTTTMAESTLRRVEVGDQDDEKPTKGVGRQRNDTISGHEGKTTNVSQLAPPRAFHRPPSGGVRTGVAMAPVALAPVTKVPAGPRTTTSGTAVNPVLPTPPGSALPSPGKRSATLSVTQAETAPSAADSVMHAVDQGHTEVVRDQSHVESIADASDTGVTKDNHATSDRPIRRAVSWHSTVQTPVRPTPRSPVPLADQDPAPTAPRVWLELDLEPTPRSQPASATHVPLGALSSALDLAHSSPSTAPIVRKPVSLKVGTKRKRSPSPSTSAAQSLALAPAPSGPASPRPVPPTVFPRRSHTLAAPPSALTVSPRQALAWLAWAEDKENIDPADWLRQYEAKKKAGAAGKDDGDGDGKGGNSRRSGDGSGGAGASGQAGSAAARNRSRNSAPSASSSRARPTLSVLTVRAANVSNDPSVSDARPGKRLRTTYELKPNVSKTSLVSLCLASSSPLRPGSPPGGASAGGPSSCRGHASGTAWLARRPMDTSAAAENMDRVHSSPVAAAVLMRLRNTRSAAIR